MGGDLAADLTATDSQGRKVIVQCKRYSPEKTVGTPDLQKFIGMLIVEHKADFGIFVTTSSFSQKAIEKAKEWKAVLQLVDGNLLVKWLHILMEGTVRTGSCSDHGGHSSKFTDGTAKSQSSCSYPKGSY